MTERPSFYLPDFCRAQSVLAVILIAALVALLFTLARYGISASFWHGLTRIALFLLWVALGIAAFWCAVRGVLSRLDALAGSDTERGYPPSVGTVDLRTAASHWIARRFGVEIPADEVAACIGTKEFVGTLPQWLRLRRPDLDTVLYPAVAYPTYEMGAILAGCRPVAVPCDAVGRPDLSAISDDDASRALLLWVNSPANPSGGLTDLGEAAVHRRDGRGRRWKKIWI